MSSLQCLILAGGSGTRFWPRSRKAKPKQFLKIFGDETLIQSTISRFSGFIPEANICVVAALNQKEILEEQTQNLKKENLLYEPVGKNTLPAIGLAAIHMLKSNPEGVMIVSPADHLIKNEVLFEETILSAVKIANENGGIVTIGITPNSPATGYGYIEVADEVSIGQSIKSFGVKRFVEKPELSNAIEYLASGDYFWNAGIFVFKVSVLLKAIEICSPEIYSGLMKIYESIGHVNYESVLTETFNNFPSISIDYGIMENISNAYLVRGDFIWNDLGSWEQVYQYDEKDENLNAGSGQIIFHDTKNSYAVASDGLIAVVGMEDVIVVKENDMILVCNRNNAEDIKKIVDEIKARELKQYV